MKTCTKCLRSLALDGFHDRSDRSGKKLSWCKDCQNARRLKYERSPEGKEKKLARSRLGAASRPSRAKPKHFRTCPLCESEYEARVSHQKVCKSCAGRWQRARRYGFTSPENFLALEQTGVCSACGEPAKGRMSIDHCHETGVVRGLIHQSCNVGLGQAGDSPEILRRWISYLEKEPQLQGV
jgi:hypothetical protein